MKNFIKIFICLLLLGLGRTVEAQVNIGGKPYSLATGMKIAVGQPQNMPLLNMDLIAAQDADDQDFNRPPRFGFPHPVNLNTNNAGAWTNLDNGDRIWALQINCPGAKSVNLLYDAFYLPEGATLYIYNEAKTRVIGGFTNRNNSPDGTAAPYGTGLVYGENIILEYYEPQTVAGQGVISISTVVHGYRYIRVPGYQAEDLGTSGSCQVNVNCSPEGDNWQTEKNGVAMILVGGIRWCTGSLVNTTVNPNEFLPYFLTADHCLDGLDAVTNPIANTWSFWWHYESPNCVNPASDDDIPFVATARAVLVANNVASDFALFRLVEDPLYVTSPLTYLGWSTTNSPGSGGVGIHHPDGDIKKIATHSQVPVSTDWFGDPPPNSHWRVNWDATANGQSVTEGGSSGSPLFDDNKRVIGQLHGGSSVNCSDPDNDPGIYGKFGMSYDGNGSSDIHRRLQDWLDPACNASLSLSGAINDERPTFQASGNITSTHEIFSPGYALYLSGTQITLQPGFHARPGSTFKAKIGGCGAPRPENRSFPNVYLGSCEVVSNQPAPLALQPAGKPVTAGLRIQPNPTQGVSTLVFQLKADAAVTLTVYDLNGKLVKNILQNNQRYAGEQQISFDAGALAAGVYVCRLETADGVQTARMIVE